MAILNEKIYPNVNVLISSIFSSENSSGKILASFLFEKLLCNLDLGYQLLI